MQKIKVNTEKSYDVIIGSNALQHLADAIPKTARRILIVTDNVVDELHADNLTQALGSNCQVLKFVFVHGEDSKSQKTTFEILQFMKDNHFDRNDILIAFGGGVVGDITGFVAGIYMRGVQYIQVPTTLLSAIDSSVGGKTAINMDGVKNIVGVFNQPIAVIADIDVISTCSEEIFIDGMGEGVKYAVMCGGRLAEIVKTNSVKDNYEEFIALCVECKAEIVSIDERESGIRKSLNLGHTIAHAIETLSNHAVSHGRAVAMGIVRLTQALNKRKYISDKVCTEIKSIITPYFFGNLTVKYNASELIKIVKNDKKSHGGDITIVFTPEIGKIEYLNINYESLKQMLQDSDELNCWVAKKKINRSIKAIASKSYAHRMLIAAALGKKAVTIDCNILSEDMMATMQCLNAIGANIKYEDTKFIVNPITKLPTDEVELNCFESGSTLRFMLPIAAALGIKAKFVGRGRLGERPLKEIIEVLRCNGVTIDNDTLPLRISGKLNSGDFRISGGVSSQYITGLLMTMPLLSGDSTLSIKGEFKSKNYVDITLDVLNQCGIILEKENNIYQIQGNQTYNMPIQSTVEGDWSNAAVWVAAACVNSSNNIIAGLNKNSLQGDRRIVDIAEQMGAKVEWDDEDGSVIIRGANKLNKIDFDAEDIPDIVPMIALMCAKAQGKSVIRNINRLRDKESDRLAGIIDILHNVGVDAYADAQNLVINGGVINAVDIAQLDGLNDHRMVMMSAIAAAFTNDGIYVSTFNAVNKSYPSFFDELAKE